ncbi:MAG: RecR protein [Podoviridae sp. ctviO18]|nr:MAG: RecR protein [Podoviridae sp. ctviO18]
MEKIRKTIGLLGFCPSCLRWQGIFAFEDYICLVCRENDRDGGALKKLLVSILALIASWFGYGEYSDIKTQNLELQDKIGALEQRVNESAFGGSIDKNGDGHIDKWEKDNGMPPLMNPKYWSENR